MSAGVGAAGVITVDDSGGADFMSIQAAVDAASEGDTIEVRSGTYVENVDVRKRLTLRGEGAGVVTVTAASSLDHVFEVTANYVNISGFNATGASNVRMAGICLDSADHCNISENIASNSWNGICILSLSNYNTFIGNNCSNNYDGICLGGSSNNTLTGNTASDNERRGISLYSSSNYNTFTGNNCSNNYDGIRLWYSSNNMLTGNTASSNKDDGIYLGGSSNNTLTSNTASNSYYGIKLDDSSDNTLANNTMSENMYNFEVLYDFHEFGVNLSEYTQNIDTSNTVDGKPIYYWVDQKDRQIPSDAGFVGVVNGTNITVKDLTLTNNRRGVIFAYTENSRIENITTSNNYIGIYLYKSSNNTLASNTANSNGQGILLDSSSNNILTSNNCSNNYIGIGLDDYSGKNTLANNTANSNNFSGIFLDYSTDNTLTSNTVNTNDIHGIFLDYSSDNTLTSNNCSNNRGGILLLVSRNNTLVNNTANSNNHSGITLADYSNNNTLANNSASNNKYGIKLDEYSSNNMFTNNTASNNKYGIYLCDFYCNYNTFMNNTANSNNFSGIYMWDSSNNTLANNTANSNGNCGISLLFTSNSTITSNTANSNGDCGIFVGDAGGSNMLANNTANSNGNCGIHLESSDSMLANNTANSNGDCGIKLYYSSDNTLTSNTANSNGNCGIRLEDSSDNLIYNNYFNNTNNTYDDGNNQWNITKTNGTNIIGGPFLGGNYWSNYAGVDNDGDGLGDTLTPYNSLGGITNNGDYHPLVPTISPDPIYIPPDPVNLAHTLGNYRINYTWSLGTGNVTDSYNVNLNGIWMNGTTSTFANTSVGLEDWANITVFAYNVSGTGTQSLGCVSDSMHVPAASECNCTCGDICVNETGWWHDGGAFNANTTPIQAAVDNAGSSETICIKAGSYTENVDIATSHLTLRGEGVGVVTVTAASSLDHVFEVTANYVNISGFNATGASNVHMAGICFDSADHCNISENTASNNYIGISLYNYSSNNTLTSNIANSNGQGILLDSSSNNMLTSNNCSNNYIGISLDNFSSNNMLAINTVNSNNYSGIFLDYSTDNTLTSNIANTNDIHGIFLDYSTDNTLTSNNCSNNRGGILLLVSRNNTLVNNTANSNNYSGIVLADYSRNNTLANNTASNNYYGIKLDEYSSNNVFTNNTANLNNNSGIYLGDLCNFNTFMNNTANSNNFSGIYMWDSSNNTLANNTANSNVWYGILLFFSSNSTLTSNTANSNGDCGIFVEHAGGSNMLANNTANLNNRGIRLSSSRDNTLTRNTANSNNFSGINLYDSSNSTLTSNIANSNGDCGIRLEDSSDNLIYNNYFNNTKNAYDDGSNQWNTTKTNGINIIGGPFLGGNYWSDYAGVDNDGDGLGDTLTPYNSLGGITNDGDYHPLVPTASPDPTYIPPDPLNLTHTLGNYRVNYTWSLGTGNVTDSYNVNLNGTWMNGTASTFMNVSVSPCEWANITVLAYNMSGTGTLSEGCVSDNVQASCDTTLPVITITTPVPYKLYTVGMELNFSATDDESGVDTIAGKLTNTGGVSQIVDTGFEPEVGVYTLVVTATDNVGNTNESDPVFFVVYDPAGCSAKGKGWFNPDVESTHPGGKADFKFTASYKKDVSKGKLDFKDKDADIKLKGKSIDWLVISSVSAQFQGTGTINGEGLYTFRVQAKDNGKPGAGNDHFDIMIWNGIDTMADPYYKAKNTIANGDIKVHAK